MISKKITLFASAAVAGVLATACCKPCSNEPEVESELPPEETVSQILDAAVEAEAEATTEEPASPIMDATSMSNVVARINGEDAVTEGDVMGIILRYTGGQVPPKSEIAAFRKNIIEQLVMQRLLEKEAAKDTTEVSSDDIAKLLQEMTRGSVTNLEQFVELVKQPQDKVVEQLAQNVKIQRIYNAQTNKAEAVTEEMARAKYDEIIKLNPDAAKVPPMVNASHILVKCDDFSDTNAVAAAEAKIGELRARVVAGEDFATVAQEASDCPSGKRDGGSLGSFGRGQMVKEFEDAAFSQPIGEIGEVVKTRFGYHIIKVVSREDERELKFEDVKADILMGLQREAAGKAFEAYMKELRAAAKVEIVAEEVVSEAVAAPAAAEEAPAAAEEAPMPEWAN